MKKTLILCAWTFCGVLVLFSATFNQSANLYAQETSAVSETGLIEEVTGEEKKDKASTTDEPGIREEYEFNEEDCKKMIGNLYDLVVHKYLSGILSIVNGSEGKVDLENIGENVDGGQTKILAMLRLLVVNVVMRHHVPWILVVIGVVILGRFVKILGLDL